MADRYRVLTHPALGQQVRRLQAAAQQDPNGTEAQELRGLTDGLKALRDGRESELGYKQMHSLVDKYGDISDCAEVKVPVVREFAPNGYEFGPSHRLTYREFDGTASDPTPVREAVAFEPRRGGQSFTVTAERLERPIGVSLAELGSAQESDSHPAVGSNQEVRREQTAQPGREAQQGRKGRQDLRTEAEQAAQASTDGRSVTQQQVRRPLPPELAAAAEAASTGQSTSTGDGPVQRTNIESDPVMAHRLAALSFPRAATEATQPASNGARLGAGQEQSRPGRRRSGPGTNAPAQDR